MALFSMSNMFKNVKSEVDTSKFMKKSVPEDREYVPPEYEKSTDIYEKPEFTSDAAMERFNTELDEIVEKANFMKYKPGTYQWKAIWAAHPELQEKMLDWAKRIFIWCEERNQRISFSICINMQKHAECHECKRATESIFGSEKEEQNGL